MKSRTYLIIASLFLLAAFFQACNKINNCLKSQGNIIVESRSLPSFHRISMFDNIDVIIVPSSLDLLEVKGGENIIDGIVTEVENGVLSIRNENKCNWLRDLNALLEVYIYTDSVENVQYNSTGILRTHQQTKFDSLQIDIWNGAGSIYMDVMANELILKQHSGAVDVHFKGMAERLSIFSASYGPFLCDSLIVNTVSVVQSSTNDCSVQAEYKLNVDISGKGNVYYRGEPEILVWESSGEGKLYHLN